MRGTRAVSVARGIVFVLVLLLAFGAYPARGATKTRTYTNTDGILVWSSGSAIPYPSEIKVGGALKGGRVTDVNVTLIFIVHPYPSELDILLRGPSGRTLVLMSDVVAANQSGMPLNFTLDDEASGWLTSTTHAGGTYKPSDDAYPDFFADPAPQHMFLQVFDGGPASGTWTLFVTDDTSDSGGSIAGWSLTITARV